MGGCCGGGAGKNPQLDYEANAEVEGLVAAGIGAKLWEDKLVHELEKKTLVKFTEKGHVEFFRQGEAPYVMMIHGQMSGWDLCMEPLVKQHWVDAGYGVICPSRAGYLRSTIRGAPVNAEEQADMYKMMLDEVRVDSVVVVAYGAGGPSGIHFAVKYPQNTDALITLSAFTGKQEEEQTPEPTFTGVGSLHYTNWNSFLVDKDSSFCCAGPGQSIQATIFSDVMNSPMASYVVWHANKEPEAALQNALTQLTNFTEEDMKIEIDRIMANQTLVAAVKKLLIDGHVPIGPRWPGNINDMTQQKYVHLHEELENVKVPTMVIQDANAGAFGVGVANAEHMQKYLPSSSLKEYIIAPTAWHVLWLAPEWSDLAAKQVAFAQEHKGATLSADSGTPAGGNTTDDTVSHIKSAGSGTSAGGNTTNETVSHIKLL